MEEWLAGMEIIINVISSFVTSMFAWLLNHADFLTAVGTILLGAIAVFQDRLRAIFYSPKLDCVIEAAPPDCHKTTRRNCSISFSA
jgi:hypothetical protein